MGKDVKSRYAEIKKEVLKEFVYSDKPFSGQRHDEYITQCLQVMELCIIKILEQNIKTEE